MKSNPTLFTQLPTQNGWGAVVLVLWILFPIAGWAQSASAASPVPEATKNAASRGEALFTGRTQLHNGGPACVTCHSIAGISVPHEGTLGPNLTHVYTMLGPQGTGAMLQPPYVGLMVGAYGHHSLAPEEQRDLIAFLKRSTTLSEAPGGVPTSNLPPGSASRGKSLFAGHTHFRNGGPACIACHSIAGLSFPNGGTLGPNLTNVYAKLGQRGAEAAMQTLYFGVMTPIYIQHPVVSQEQADLLAFLKESETKPQTHWNTQILILIAFLWGGVFVALTAFLWRDRVRSVRRALVDRARGQGARS